MFNENLKNQYIDKYMLVTESLNKEKMKSSLINLFNRLEPHETAIGKDFIQMDKEEILTVLSKFLCGGKDYQTTTLSLLSQYLNWGVENGTSFLKDNILFKMPLSSIDVSESYSNSMVKDEQDLKHCLDAIFSPLEEDFSDNLVRCFLVLVFCGIDPADVLLLREDDINIKKREITYMRHIIKIPDEAFKVINHVINMDTIYKRSPRGGGVFGLKVFKLGYVISNTVDEASVEYRIRLRRTFDSMISKKFRDSERALTQKKVATSGVFYRMYLKEQESGEIDCSEYLFQSRNNIKTIENSQKVAQVAKEEYLVWKKAFKLD